MPSRSPSTGAEVPRGELDPALELYMDTFTNPALDMSKEDPKAVAFLKKFAGSTQRIRSFAERSALGSQVNPRTLQNHFHILLQEAHKYKQESPLVYGAGVIGRWHEVVTPEMQLQVDSWLKTASQSEFADLDNYKSLDTIEDMIANGIFEMDPGTKGQGYYYIKDGLLVIDSLKILKELARLDKGFLEESKELRDIRDTIEQIAYIDAIEFGSKTDPAMRHIYEFQKSTGIKPDSTNARAIFAVLGLTGAALQAISGSPTGVAIWGTIAGVSILSGKNDPLSGHADAWREAQKHPEFRGKAGAENLAMLMEDSEIRKLCLECNKTRDPEQFFDGEDGLNDLLGYKDRSSKQERAVVRALRSILKSNPGAFYGLMVIIGNTSNENRQDQLTIWMKENFAPAENVIRLNTKDAEDNNPDTRLGGFTM